MNEAAPPPVPKRGPTSKPASAKDIFKVFRQASSIASMVSFFVAGIFGAIATIVIGSPLAMGVAMYLGNTEPNTPHVGYPWGFAVPALAIWIFGLFLEYRLGRPWVGAFLSHLGAIVFVLIPFLHIYRLWSAT
jgi:hypothetical protein